jgi:hypothetical protein
MGAKMYNDCGGKDQQQITALGTQSAVVGMEAKVSPLLQAATKSQLVKT